MTGLFSFPETGEANMYDPITVAKSVEKVMSSVNDKIETMSSKFASLTAQQQESQLARYTAQQKESQQQKVAQQNMDLSPLHASHRYLMEQNTKLMQDLLAAHNTKFDKFEAAMNNHITTQLKQSNMMLQQAADDRARTEQHALRTNHSQLAMAAILAGEILNLVNCYLILFCCV